MNQQFHTYFEAFLLTLYDWFGERSPNPAAPGSNSCLLTFFFSTKQIKIAFYDFNNFTL